MLTRSSVPRWGERAFKWHYDLLNPLHVLQPLPIQINQRMLDVSFHYLRHKADEIPEFKDLRSIAEIPRFLCQSCGYTYATTLSTFSLLLLYRWMRGPLFAQDKDISGLTYVVEPYKVTDTTQPHREAENRSRDENIPGPEVPGFHTQRQTLHMATVGKRVGESDVIGLTTINITGYTLTTK
ncbi:hypothetical protein K440DRAFT_428092 [Wilcoxina mikolae CBS 423.85]|nr:hypothetical protein K440DRAFT_428092 [Wilcoxina mikolae CBS 423.85]